ncbi:capsular biosynthesis protein [Sulfuricurvum sp.]|uniref:capsule biosynthesis protein n=1 Tax=Sulfuricurvum sp. TaxID=2025608 RepID=UPI002E315CB1|nr:capsular biosynthesis protein [Sulfuricurvum sp.]HEX5330350.1 capsular biosynthesis protein [Sulfuricurvum sp.]
MVHRGLESFKNKHVVLLQGPVGPFFKHLSFDLQQIGATVHKINFNGGDWFFSSSNATNFTGTFEDWSDFFIGFIERHQIDTILLFGDCRAYHRVAHAIADKKGLDIGVFEEGYVRPDYITFEEFGVNGHSKLPRDPNFYMSLTDSEFTVAETVPVKYVFWHTAWYAFLYYFWSALLFPLFYGYQHHRSLSPWEITFWIRSVWRKQWYKLKEAGICNELTTVYSKKYYLSPLQISTDAQVTEHSQFDSIEHFIEKIIGSFAFYAPVETILVIKHHPLDRGYHDYSKLIKKVSTHHNVFSRVRYIHDIHLPTLLEHARGAVMINSTVGLSAIHHNAPLKVCGSAIYDIDGLTYRGTLDDFWVDAVNFKVNYELYIRFKKYVISKSQINGNFYRRLKNTHLNSGIIW